MLVGLNSAADQTFEVLDLAYPSKTCVSPPNLPRAAARAFAGIEPAAEKVKLKKKLNAVSIHF